MHLGFAAGKLGWSVSNLLCLQITPFSPRSASAKSFFDVLPLLHSPPMQVAAEVARRQHILGSLDANYTLVVCIHPCSVLLRAKPGSVMCCACLALQVAAWMVCGQPSMLCKRHLLISVCSCALSLFLHSC